MAVRRALHTFTLLPDGKVIVAGGLGAGVLSSAELYDPATGIWSTTGTMVSSRYIHTATLLPSGKVLVAGGLDSIFEPKDPQAGWSDTSFTSRQTKGFPPGPAQVTIFTNGIPSVAKYITLTARATGAE